MAAALNVAAAVGNLKPNFLDVFQSDGPVAARGQAPRLVGRNSSSVPTVNMFFNNDGTSYEFAASIIDACIDKTTYAIRCTAPAYKDGCGAYIEPMTVTSGPSIYRVSTLIVARAAGTDVSLLLDQTCDLQGTTQAVCTTTTGVSLDGTTTTESATVTLSGSTYYRYDVAITGGAEKTVSPTAECKPAPTRTSGASTKAVAMRGLFGVVGAASLLGF